MTRNKLSAFGTFATSRAVDDARNALLEKGFPAADITVRPPDSEAVQDGTARLLTVQGNTAVDMDAAKEIIERSGADDVSSTGESVITTQRMDRTLGNGRIL